MYGYRDLIDAEDAVRECLNDTDMVNLQNILMRVPDKVCAVAFRILDEPRRRELLAIIAPQKAKRILDELRLEARRRTSQATRTTILRGFLSFFGQEGKFKKHIWIKRKQSR